MARKSLPRARQLKSGNWNAQVFLGFSDDGRKLRESFTAPTKWEAERAAAQFILNGMKEADRFTVADALDGYIKAKENVLAPSTIRGYRIHRRNHLQSLMMLDVHEVNSFTMQQAINEDAAQISSKTIKEAKNLICSALRMYDIKPTLNVTFPARKPKLKELPTAEQVMNMVRGTDIELPCLLAMWLSLRMGEVRGLQFCDLHDSVLTVCRSNIYFDGKNNIRDLNKTYKSTRRLTVPDYIKQLIEAVPHKKEDEFIVQMEYQTLRSKFYKLLEERGYHMTFHDLRHLSASVMLMLNIPDKYAMERGGWSTNSTLKSVYQHTFSDERKKVDKKIDDYFNSIIGTPKEG
ncbi:site-specific integrase [Ruminococcus sp.]|uniref:site-specific integrase n=1 Tax=Ruminococcus sp. TaxID=41978 RepID=UPI0025D6E45E|nr:site-specific integrase [Ruminococcus sp.]